MVLQQLSQCPQRPLWTMWTTPLRFWDKDKGSRHVPFNLYSDWNPGTHPWIFGLWPFILSKTILDKVENILKGSLDLIHHIHLQWKFKLWTVKFAWCVRAKCCWAETKTKSLLTSPSNALTYYLSKVNIPDNNLNFHWTWR